MESCGSFSCIVELSKFYDCISSFSCLTIEGGAWVFVGTRQTLGMGEYREGMRNRESERKTFRPCVDTYRMALTLGERATDRTEGCSVVEQWNTCNGARYGSRNYFHSSFWILSGEIRFSTRIDCILFLIDPCRNEDKLDPAYLLCRGAVHLYHLFLISEQIRMEIEKTLVFGLKYGYSVIKTPFFVPEPDRFLTRWWASNCSQGTSL